MVLNAVEHKGVIAKDETANLRPFHFGNEGKPPVVLGGLKTQRLHERPLCSPEETMGRGTELAGDVRCCLLKGGGLGAVWANEIALPA